MLLKTHVATAFALALVLDNMLCSDIIYATAYHVRAFLIFLSAGIQLVLDQFGHRWKTIGDRRIPVRNKLHSLPAIILLTTLLGIPALVSNRPIVLIIPLSAGILHWLEDLVTEGGVYMLGRRIRLPLRIGYDNPSVNRTVVVLFLALLLMYTKPFSSLFNFVMVSISALLLMYAFLSV